MSDKFKQLMDDLMVLNSLEEGFQELEFEQIEAITEIGEWDRGAALIDGNWIAKSEMRSDGDNTIYISNWLYAKLF